MTFRDTDTMDAATANEDADLDYDDGATNAGGSQQPCVTCGRRRGSECPVQGQGGEQASFHGSFCLICKATYWLIWFQLTLPLFLKWLEESDEHRELFRQRCSQLISALRKGKIRESDLHEPEEKVQVRRSFRVIERPDAKIQCFKTKDSFMGAFSNKTPKSQGVGEKKLDITAGKVPTTNGYCVTSGDVGLTCFLDEVVTEVVIIQERHLGKVQQIFRGHQSEVFTKELCHWRSKLPKNLVSANELLKLKSHVPCIGGEFSTPGKAESAIGDGDDSDFDDEKDLADSASKRRGKNKAGAASASAAGLLAKTPEELLQDDWETLALEIEEALDQYHLEGTLQLERQGKKRSNTRVSELKQKFLTASMFESGAIQQMDDLIQEILALTKLETVSKNYNVDQPQGQYRKSWFNAMEEAAKYSKRVPKKFQVHKMQSMVTQFVKDCKPVEALAQWKHLVVQQCGTQAQWISMAQQVLSSKLAQIQLLKGAGRSDRVLTHASVVEQLKPLGKDMLDAAPMLQPLEQLRRILEGECNPQTGDFEQELNQATSRPQHKTCYNIVCVLRCFA